MGRLDYLRDQSNDSQFQQDVECDLTMLVAESMKANARREGRLVGGERQPHATSGWKNRGMFFWITLAIMVYWFFLRPMGL